MNRISPVHDPCLCSQSGLLLALYFQPKLLARSTSGHPHDLLAPEGTATVLTPTHAHRLAAIASKVTSGTCTSASSLFLPPEVQHLVLSSHQREEGSLPYPCMRICHWGRLSWLWELVAQQSSRFRSSLASLGWSSSTSKYRASLRYFTTGYSDSW